MLRTVTDIYTYFLTLLSILFIIYNFFKSKPRICRIYSEPAWYYTLKYQFAKLAVKKLQAECRESTNGISNLEECKKNILTEQCDTHFFCGLNQEGDSVFIKVSLHSNRTAQVSLCIRLADGETFSYPAEEQEVVPCIINAHSWCAGGLTIEVMEPMKKLKVTYRGWLKSLSTNKKEMVTFEFLWEAISAPLHFPQDASLHLLTDAITKEKWRDGNWVQMLGDDRAYEQYGSLNGSIEIKNQQKTIALHLASWRKRVWGTSHYRNLRRNFFLLGMSDDGVLFNVAAQSLKTGCTHLNYGSVKDEYGETRTVDRNDLNLETIAEYKNIPKTFLINFRAKYWFRCAVHVPADDITSSYSRKNKCQLMIAPADCNLNTSQAKAIIVAWYEK